MDSLPPTTIDGARVLWWAWAGDVPFGMCGTEEIYGFAVCRYDDDAGVYRFSCDLHWEAVNDSLHDDEAEAMAAVPLNYEAALGRVRWRKSEETLIGANGLD